jgi:hypothetical protein
MSYQSDFEMLHAKWPAAVSTYCYDSRNFDPF